jgi:hypothetical protein
MRAALETLLSGKAPVKVNGKNASGAEALAWMVFYKALNGDLKAWELVRDTAGQKPKEKETPATVVVNNLFDVLQNVETSDINDIPEIDEDEDE